MPGNNHILITGNGIFLENYPSLSLNSIHNRFDESFLMLSNEFLGHSSQKFPFLGKRLEKWNLITFGDSYLSEYLLSLQKSLINCNWEMNYEEKVGVFVENLLNYYKEKVSQGYPKNLVILILKTVYSDVINLVQSIMFMELPNSIKSMKVSIPEGLISKSKTHYTFNFLFKVQGMNVNMEDSYKARFFLHGQYNLERWVSNIDINKELVKIASMPNESALVILKRNLSSDPFNFDTPMIFGRSISQKIRLIKLFAEYKYTENKDIREAQEKVIPYLDLEKKSVNSTIHIYGINPANHIELLDLLKGANSVKWYWYSKNDEEQLMRLKEKYSYLTLVSSHNLKK